VRARRLPDRRRVGIVTVSGGFGIQLCDAAEREGLDVAPLPEAAQEKLKQINPLGGAANPCDTTSNFLNDMSVIGKTFRAMYAEGGYDALIGSFTVLPASPTYGEKIRKAIREGTEGYLDRPTLLCMAAPAAVEHAYDEAGFLVFSDSERAARALGALASLQEGFARQLIVPAIDHSLARPIGTAALSEAGAQALLSGIGVPFLPAQVVSSAEAAAEAANALGLPVAMKIVSPDILHKTEIGGVIPGVATAEAASEAYATLRAGAAEKAPAAVIEGVLVTPMAPNGIETIIGVTRDPVFGPAVMFGLGGIFAELFRDVAFRAAPFDLAEAHRMIRETRGHTLLAGFRGRPPADVDALARMLVLISQYAAANADRLETVDLNPVLVREAGQGLVALDAVVVPRATP
jgi:acyl-CoA synthetase (NDP forming)